MLKELFFFIIIEFFKIERFIFSIPKFYSYTSYLLPKIIQIKLLIFFRFLNLRKLFKFNLQFLNHFIYQRIFVTWTLGCRDHLARRRSQKEQATYSHPYLEHKI